MNRSGYNRTATLSRSALALFCLLYANSVNAQGRDHENGGQQQGPGQGRQRQQLAASQQQAQRNAQDGQRAQQAVQQQQQQQQAQRNAQEGQRAQQAAQRQQQQQSRDQQQQQSRDQQQQAQRNAQEGQRAQQAAQRQQQQQSRDQQQQQSRDQQQQTRNQQQQDQHNVRDGQRAQQAAQQQQQQQQQQARAQQQSRDQQQQSRDQQHRDPRNTARRPSTLPPLNVHSVPLQNAFRNPDFNRRGSNAQQGRGMTFERNMRAHLTAVPFSQAPRNFAGIRNAQMSSYYNNYPISVANQQYYINRQNTRYFPVQQGNYPNWYQPNNGWTYSNGFSLANAITVGLDWLFSGWQPNYGDTPTGFICASDYVPTQWIYDPAEAQWRQPGLNTYISEGPDEEYTGPITVQVVEQYSGRGGRIINVPYLYDAFYYPEVGRWGYKNSQGYFIWLDV